MAKTIAQSVRESEARELAYLEKLLDQTSRWRQDRRPDERSATFREVLELMQKEALDRQEQGLPFSDVDCADPPEAGTVNTGNTDPYFLYRSYLLPAGIETTVTVDPKTGKARVYRWVRRLAERATCDAAWPIGRHLAGRVIEVALDLERPKEEILGGVGRVLEWVQSYRRESKDALMLHMRECGLSYDSIAQRLEISSSSVARRIQEICELQGREVPERGSLVAQPMCQGCNDKVGECTGKKTPRNCYWKTLIGAGGGSSYGDVRADDAADRQVQKHGGRDTTGMPF